MKRLFALAVVGALALPAAAGDGVDGYSCSNGCPLAKEANTHRTTGTEALTVSPVLRRDVAAVVVRNLERI